MVLVCRPVDTFEAMPPESSNDDEVSQPLSGLAPLLYQELRALAYQFFRHERPDHTLQPTALVHEAYIRLVQQQGRGWTSRAEFIGAAVLMIRRILVDHARKRLTVKRGAGRKPASLDEHGPAVPEQDAPLVALDEALDRLTELDPRKSRIIELRFFGGLSEEETAALLELSSRTIRREWRLARAWLRREIDGGQGDDP